MSLLSETMTYGDGPQRLYGRWRVGDIDDADLPDLIPLIWTRANDDRPEQAIGTAAWVALFRTAGLVVCKTNQPALPDRVTLYRGAPWHRCRRMAWTTDPQTAEHFRRRCEQFGETAHVYQATVGRAAVLGMFDIRPEHEVVIDPALLDRVDLYQLATPSRNDLQ